MEASDLLKRLKRNDEKAFEVLFRRYFYALLEYTKFYTSNSQIAEDMVHDVFYRISDIRATMEVHTSIKSYLCRAVHNNCIQYLRHQKVVQNHNKSHQPILEEALILNKLYYETLSTMRISKEKMNWLLKLKLVGSSRMAGFPGCFTS